MELSLLCDVNIFLYIHDEANNKVVHFQSTPENDIRHVFNKHCQREFYSNNDYVRINGMDSLNYCHKEEANPEKKLENRGSGSGAEESEDDDQHAQHALDDLGDLDNSQ